MLFASLWQSIHMKEEVLCRPQHMLGSTGNLFFRRLLHEEMTVGQGRRQGHHGLSINSEYSYCTIRAAVSLSLLLVKHWWRNQYLDSGNLLFIQLWLVIVGVDKISETA